MKTEKRCPQCNLTKDRIEFAGSNGYCKPCMNEYSRSRNHSRPEFEASILTDKEINLDGALEQSDMKNINCLSSIFDKQYKKLLGVTF